MSYHQHERQWSHIKDAKVAASHYILAAFKSLYGIRKHLVLSNLGLLKNSMYGGDYQGSDGTSGPCGSSRLSLQPNVPIMR